MDLIKFSQTVNDLARREADAVQGLFKGVHYDFPVRMLESYFQDGLTPKQTLRQISAQARAENEAEARTS
jgi:hypothetical protein